MVRTNLPVGKPLPRHTMAAGAMQHADSMDSSEDHFDEQYRADSEVWSWVSITC